MNLDAVSLVAVGAVDRGLLEFGRGRWFGSVARLLHDRALLRLNIPCLSVSEMCYGSNLFASKL